MDLREAGVSIHPPHARGAVGTARLCDVDGAVLRAVGADLRPRGKVELGLGLGGGVRGDFPPHRLALLEVGLIGDLMVNPNTRKDGPLPFWPTDKQSTILFIQFIIFSDLPPGYLFPALLRIVMRRILEQGHRKVSAKGMFLSSTDRLKEEDT